MSYSNLDQTITTHSQQQINEQFEQSLAELYLRIAAIKAINLNQLTTNKNLGLLKVQRQNFTDSLYDMIKVAKNMKPQLGCQFLDNFNKALGTPEDINTWLAKDSKANETFARVEQFIVEFNDKTYPYDKTPSIFSLRQKAALALLANMAVFLLSLAVFVAISVGIAYAIAALAPAIVPAWAMALTKFGFNIYYLTSICISYVITDKVYNPIKESLGLDTTDNLFSVLRSGQHTVEQESQSYLSKFSIFLSDKKSSPINENASEGFEMAGLSESF